jgi:RNA polymerase sigma factor (sigma-70 family)
MLSYTHLQQLKLETLVFAAKVDPSNRSLAMNEIVRRFQKTAAIIAARVCFNPDNRDAVANAALLALVMAVRSHDIEKPGFRSYAEITMKGAARRESMQLANSKWVTDDQVVEAIRDKEARVAGDPNADYDPRPYGDFDAIVTELKPSQQRLVEMRYRYDLTVTEIAEINGVTTSAVSQRLGTVHRFLISRYPAA